MRKLSYAIYFLCLACEAPHSVSSHWLGGWSVAFATSAAAKGSKVPPPPPVSMPIWSLATPASSLSQELECSTSMNIVTFATPVSVGSPKLWAVSLYYDTLTKDSFCENGHAVLQLLCPEHKYLVSVLGKNSGYNFPSYSKYEECRKLGFKWNSKSDLAAGFSLLPGCATYIKLKLRTLHEAGDHVVALCEVVGTGRWDESRRRIILCKEGDQSLEPLDGRTALYTGQLREEGLL